MLPAVKEKLLVQEHKEEKVPDGKIGGADKDEEGDKMEGKCFIQHRMFSRIYRKCGLKYRLYIG